MKDQTTKDQEAEIAYLRDCVSRQAAVISAKDAELTALRASLQQVVGEIRADSQRVRRALQYPVNGHHYCRSCGQRITGGGDHATACNYVVTCEEIDETRAIVEGWADRLAALSPLPVDGQETKKSARVDSQW